MDRSDKPPFKTGQLAWIKWKGAFWPSQVLRRKKTKYIEKKVYVYIFGKEKHVWEWEDEIHSYAEGRKKYILKNKCRDPRWMAAVKFSESAYKAGIIPNPLYNTSKKGRKLYSRIEIGAKPLKIGFVGLGCFVTDIVLRSLLRSGCKVTVWSSTIKELVNDGDYSFYKYSAKALESSETLEGRMEAVMWVPIGYFKDDEYNCIWTFDVAPDPGAVVKTSDIVFSSFMNYENREKAMKSEYGLLTPGVYSSKGFVEMSVLDPESSKETSKAITDLEGDYLEACFLHSVQLAEEGRLIMLLAGSEKLFKKCMNIFHFMALKILYYGEDVGTASTLNLLYHFQLSSFVVSLAEVTALCKKIGLTNDTRLVLPKILKLPHYLESQAHAMMTEEYVADTTVQYMRNSLSMMQKTLYLNNVPAAIIAATLQIYTSAIRRGFGREDICAVHKISRPPVGLL